MPEIAEAAWEGGRRERWSVAGEAVTVCRFDDEAGSGHGREALIEGGGAEAAGCPQFGERPGLLAVGEGCGDPLIDGTWFDTALGLAIGLDRLEGKGVARWISSSVTPGTAAAARCSTVRTMRSLLSRRR